MSSKTVHIKKLQKKLKCDNVSDICELFQESMECVICCELMLPPIVQCETGHTLCSRCANILKICPTCNQSVLTGIRNLAIEALSVYIKYPCRYVNDGCNAVLSSMVKIRHESHCIYRGYSCPLGDPTCSFVSHDIKKVIQHIAGGHNNIPIIVDDNISISAQKYQLDTMHITLFCFYRLFMIDLKKITNDGKTIFCLMVRLIGSPETARRFRFFVSIKKNDSEKLLRKGKVQSIKRNIPEDLLQSRYVISEELIGNSVEYDIHIKNVLTKKETVVHTVKK